MKKIKLFCLIVSVPCLTCIGLYAYSAFYPFAPLIEGVYTTKAKRLEYRDADRIIENKLLGQPLPNGERPYVSPYDRIQVLKATHSANQERPHFFDRALLIKSTGDRSIDLVSVSLDDKYPPTIIKKENIYLTIDAPFYKKIRLAFNTLFGTEPSLRDQDLEFITTNNEPAGHYIYSGHYGRSGSPTSYIPKSDYKIYIGRLEETPYIKYDSDLSHIAEFLFNKKSSIPFGVDINNFSEKYIPILTDEISTAKYEDEQRINRVSAKIKAALSYTDEDFQKDFHDILSND